MHVMMPMRDLTLLGDFLLGSKIYTFPLTSTRGGSLDFGDSEERVSWLSFTVLASLTN